MIALNRVYWCLLIGTLGGCQEEPPVVAAVAPRSAEAAQVLGDVPLADYQRDLLQFAFEAASKFPSKPHSKNRGRAQDLVVSACFRMEQPLLAARYAPDVEGWRRGVAYADFAWCCAKVGDAAQAKQYVKLARYVLDEQRRDQHSQEWRADKVRIKIARALATLGDDDSAQSELAMVSPASSGAVDSGWTHTMAERVSSMTLAEAKAELTRITDLFPAQVLGDQYSSLMLLSGMHGQFFGDKKLRSAIEKLLFVTFQKLPTNLRLDAMAPLVEHYVENGDGDSGRDVILKMTNLMSQFSFRTEERLPQLARIAQLRNTCGDTGRAEVELVAALKDYHDHRDEVVNIYRCETLRPVALAWHALGNTSQADDLIALALEESLENPNSRPRCDDLVETCIALAEHQLKPSPELWQRMTEIGEGLSAPW